MTNFFEKRDQLYLEYNDLVDKKNNILKKIDKIERLIMEEKTVGIFYLLVFA